MKDEYKYKNFNNSKDYYGNLQPLPVLYTLNDVY